MLGLLRGESVSRSGAFYRVSHLRLAPAHDPALSPTSTVSGSSDAGLAAARALGATAIEYPRPAHEYATHADETIARGIRIGIIARESSTAAWEVARQRFPEDRKGRIKH